MTAITSLGGGHGLFATLRAVRRIAVYWFFFIL